MQVLVLDSSYRYLGTIDWQKATTILFKGLAEPVMPFKLKEEHLHILDKVVNQVCPGVKEMPYKVVTGIKGYVIVPKVIRLIKLVRETFKSHVPFNKSNIFIRDGFKCQYCSKKVTKTTGELEHIIPKSRGGKYTWENCVCSCASCNRKKNDRTPQEAGMRLISNKYSQPTVFEWFSKGMLDSGALEVLKSLNLA